MHDILKRRKYLIKGYCMQGGKRNPQAVQRVRVLDDTLVQCVVCVFSTCFNGSVLLPPSVEEWCVRSMHFICIGCHASLKNNVSFPE